jgi:predicted protein tyrosine phosphatase
MSRSRWIQVGKGRLTVWHRPGIKSLTALKESGCDEILTLLSAKEGASEIGKAVIEAGMNWTWFPMENGNPPAGAAREKLLEVVPKMIEKLESGSSILVHCSAGIHRTGMFTYALLRSIGFGQEHSLKLIAEMRLETATGLRFKHLDWWPETGKQKDGT